MSSLAIHHSFIWPNFLTQKSSLVELFIVGIQNVYWAENQLVRILLRMKNATTSKALEHAIHNHLELTKGHASRLEHIFELLDQTIDAKKCDAITALAHEAEEIIEYTDEGTATRDLGIIMIGQKIAHYELATYTGLAKLAMTIGRDDVAVLLEETLEEEKESIELLTTMSDTIAQKAQAEN